MVGFGGVMGVNKAIQSVRIPQIVEAAVEIIAEKGIKETTLDAVAKKAGLSKGGLIHYFPTKKALIETVVKEFFSRIFQRGKEIRDSFSDPYEQLISFVWLYNRDDPDYFNGYRMFFEIMIVASMNEEYRQVFHQWVNGWVELLKASIEKGVKKGDFKVEDSEEAAKTISAIYQGVASRWFLDPENHSDRWAKNTVKNLIKFVVSKK